jgi:two-component system chemotaxis response regulator CheY
MENELEGNTMGQVLIVDDSASIRMLLSKTLEDTGYCVTDAENGKAALEVAQQGNFDLVITDVNMPEMDGLRLVENLRKLPAYRMKPILVLSTEYSQEMKQKGKEAGATGWLVKPFDPQKMVEVVNKVVG